MVCAAANMSEIALVVAPRRVRMDVLGGDGGEFRQRRAADDALLFMPHHEDARCGTR
jgi:hypothetical protein